MTFSLEKMDAGNRFNSAFIGCSLNENGRIAYGAAD
jgi:hypothetical protein